MLKKNLAALLLANAACLGAAQAAPSESTPKSLGDRISASISQASANASDLLRHASSAIGTPYRKGGASAETGFDCSGFVLAMYEKTVGLTLPRTAALQAAAGKKIERHELKPGDLVFFNTMRRQFSHVGIYMGEGNFIHSPRSGARVRVESLNTPYWKTRYNGARRVHSFEAPPALAAKADTRPPPLLGRDMTAPSSVRLGGIWGPARPDAPDAQPGSDAPSTSPATPSDGAGDAYNAI